MIFYKVISKICFVFSFVIICFIKGVIVVFVGIVCSGYKCGSVFFVLCLLECFDKCLFNRGFRGKLRWDFFLVLKYKFGVIFGGM